MNKKVEIVLSPEAEEVYKYLNEQASKSKLNAIEKKKRTNKSKHALRRTNSKKINSC